MDPHRPQSVEAAVQIQTAKIEDLGTVVALAQDLYEEIAHQVPAADCLATAERLLGDSRHFFALLAFRANRPIALVTVSEESAMYAGGSYGHVQEFYVTPEERSAGVGRLLVHELRRVAIDRGWSRVEVTAAKDSARALAFYLSNGFEETGPRLKLPLS